MATMTTHAPGTFCWFELTTRDQKSAKQFYAQLFGSEIADSPIGEGESYTILKLAGRDAAGIGPMREKDYPPGTPSHWMAYLATDDVDASTQKVTAAGGKVLAPPFDVMDYGRMAVCVDPNGGTFALWQAKQHAGVGVTGEPGSFGWCQLNVPSGGREAAKKFYTSVFGWTTREDPMPMGDVYTTWLLPGLRGGMMPMTSDVRTHAHWLIYFASADVDATATKAKSLGGDVMVPPMDIPGVGRFAVLADPQGAIFAIVKFSGPMAG